MISVPSSIADSFDSMDSVPSDRDGRMVGWTGAPECNEFEYCSEDLVDDL